ncbi:MAG: hypothetical protein DMF69_22705 [Acidobacteria bacterium]|nr:MAG: hypothetical protein DMF69_22705 [Acidobacteriota bacterium]
MGCLLCISSDAKKFRSCINFFTQGRSLEEISKIFLNFWKTPESPLFWFHTHTVSPTFSDNDDRIMSQWSYLSMPGVLIPPSGKGTVVFDGNGEIPASSDKRKKCL